MTTTTEQLSEVDAVIVSTILEDFLDQLVIMGRILPASLEHRSNAEDIVKGEIGNVISNQMFLQVISVCVEDEVDRAPITLDVHDFSSNWTIEIFRDYLKNESAHIG